MVDDADSAHIGGVDAVDSCLVVAADFQAGIDKVQVLVGLHEPCHLAGGHVTFGLLEGSLFRVEICCLPHLRLQENQGRGGVRLSDCRDKVGKSAFDLFGVGI